MCIHIYIYTHTFFSSSASPPLTTLSHAMDASTDASMIRNRQRQ